MQKYMHGEKLPWRLQRKVLNLQLENLPFCSGVRKNLIFNKNTQESQKGHLNLIVLLSVLYFGSFLKQEPQKMCPHGVWTGSLETSKQMGHFRSSSGSPTNRDSS